MSNYGEWQESKKNTRWKKERNVIKANWFFLQSY